MIKAILVEPEKNDLRLLQQDIQSYCPQISICGSASSLSEANLLVKKHKPSLAFINAEMPMDCQSEIFLNNSNVQLQTILTAKTSAPPAKVFRFQVSGFLLKPLKTEDLLEAVNIAQYRIMQKVEPSELVPENILQPDNLIGIPTIEGFDFFSADQIVRCEGYQNCTRIVTLNQSDIISSYNIGVFRKMLEKHNFFAPHKSHLINLRHIRKYYKEGSLQMSDLSTVPVAKRRKTEFLKIMSLSR